MAEEPGYGDWRSLELAIKDAAKKKARQEGTGISATTVDAQIRQARYDRFLSRVFTDGQESEWLLKGGMSMLARVPRSRTTKDVDLAAQHSADLDKAERALSSRQTGCTCAGPSSHALTGCFQWPTRSPTRCAPR